MTPLCHAPPCVCVTGAEGTWRTGSGSHHIHGGDKARCAGGVGSPTQRQHAAGGRLPGPPRSGPPGGIYPVPAAVAQTARGPLRRQGPPAPPPPFLCHTLTFACLCCWVSPMSASLISTLYFCVSLCFSPCGYMCVCDRVVVMSSTPSLSFSLSVSLSFSLCFSFFPPPPSLSLSLSLPLLSSLSLPPCLPSCHRRKQADTL